MKKKDKKQKKGKVKKEDLHKHKGLTSGYLYADGDLINPSFKSALNIGSLALQEQKNNLIGIDSVLNLNEKSSLITESATGALKGIASATELVKMPSSSLILPSLNEAFSAFDEIGSAVRGMVTMKESLSASLVLPNMQEMFSVADGITNLAEDMKLITQPITLAIDNSATLFGSLVNEMINPCKEIIEGATLNLSALNSVSEFKESIGLNLNVESFKRIIDTDEYILAGNATETHLHQDFGISAHSEFALRLHGIEEKLEYQNELLEENNELRRENNQLTEALLDLTTFMKENRTGKAKVKEIKYNHRFTEIIIDNRAVKLRGNTNQSLLCQIILKEEARLSKRWEMMDLVEAMGENEFQDKDWSRIIYDAVRNINNKIGLETGIKDFFIITMKTVEINPKYLNF